MEGIELLKNRTSKFNSYLEITPIFSIFINNCKTGRNGFNTQNFLFESELIQLTSILYVSSDNYENSISHFLDINELEEEVSRYQDQIDDYHSQGFIKIGYFDINDIILLGISIGNADQIWKLNGDWGDSRPYIEKLSENIFDFVNCFHEVILNLNLDARDIDVSHLYKNWHEDFWRVKNIDLL